MSRKTFDSSEYHATLRAWDKVHCLNCGAVLPPLSERKDKPYFRSNLAKCCNAACKKAWLKRVLKNWADLRTDVIERDGYTCQDCGYIAPMEFDWDFIDDDYQAVAKFGPVPHGVTYAEWKFRCGFKARVTRKWQTDKGLEVHHIVAIKDGGEEFDENNCTTLCHDCHRLGRHGAAPKLSRAEERLQEHRRLHTSLDCFMGAVS